MKISVTTEIFRFISTPDDTGTRGRTMLKMTLIDNKRVTSFRLTIASVPALSLFSDNCPVPEICHNLL